MVQLNGADARLIVRPESTFKTLPVVLVHDCEAAWDELVDPDVTVTTDASIFKQGTKSVKLTVGANCSAGDILATDNVTAKNLANCTKIGMWIYSSVALAAGDLKLLLDDTAQCASPIETLDIPAVSAAEGIAGKYIKMPLAVPANCTAIISVGTKMAVDKGAFNFHIDDIRGLEGDAIIIPFNTAKGFALKENLEESDAISSGRQPQKPTGGEVSGAATTTHEFNPYMAILLKHLLGKVVSTNLTGGKYQHDITIGDLGEGLAIEIQHTKGQKYTVFHVKGNSLSFSQNATGKVMMDCGWELAVEEDETLASTLDGSPTNYGHKPFSAKFGAFSEGGVSAPGLATTFKIDYNNQIQGEPTIGSQGKKDSLTEGRAKINFNIDVLFKDSTILNKAKNLTESKIKIENTNGTGDGSLGNEYMSIETPEVLYSGSSPDIDGPKGLKLSFSGIAYLDDDAGGEAIKITIKNTQATL